MWQIDGSTSTSNYVKQEFNNNGASGEYVGSGNTLGGIDTTGLSNDQFNFKNYKKIIPPTPVTINLTSPKDQSFNNTPNIQVRLNATYQTANPDTISLFTNETGTWQETQTNVSVNGTQNIIHTFPEGTTLYGIRGNDTLGNTGFSSNRTITIDTIQPAISLSGELNNTPFLFNGSLQGDKIVTGNLNVTDTGGNLWTVNVSTPIETLLFNTSINSSTFLDTIRLNVENYSSGVYNLTIYAADGHTDKKIDDYKIEKPILSNALRFVEEEKKGKRKQGHLGFVEEEKKGRRKQGHLEIDPQGIGKRLETIKQKDRYQFVHDKGNAKKQTYIIRSTHHIDIVGNTQKYKAWLVIPALEKWVDFNIQNPTGREEYEIERINDKTVKVTVSNLPRREKIIFNSVGDLNTNTITRQFYVSTGNIGFTTPISEQTTQNINLNISKNDTFINGVTANLTYDGTTYTPTRQDFTDHYFWTQSLQSTSTSTEQNVTFAWNYTINGVGNSFSNATENNQTVQPVVIGSCTDFSTVAVNYTFADEQTLTALSDVTGNLLATYTLPEGSQKIYNTSFSNTDSVSLCISPSDETVVSEILLQYNKPSYVTREHYRYNQTLDGNAQNTTLYSLLTDQSTEIAFHIKDTNDDDVTDAVIRAYRLDIGTDKFIEVEEEQTDSEGDAVLRLEADDVFYKFEVWQNGIRQVATQRFIVNQANYEYTVGFIVGETPLITNLKIKQIKSNLTYTSETKTFNFTLSDSSSIATLFCLNVTNSTDEVFSACSTSNDDSLAYTVVQSEGRFDATSYATVDGRTFIIGRASTQFGGFHDEFGNKITIGLAVLMFLVIALMSVASPKIAVFGGTFALMGMYFLGLIPLGYAGLIGLIVLAVISVILMKERLGT
jgi:hypothetical protein